jgi:uncharacterized protein YdeI (YjbR/CyaY-like superfamily)
VSASVKPLPTGICFFATPANLRKWLKVHHENARELWVGFYGKSSGRPSITWPEFVDEALCVGWIGERHHMFIPPSLNLPEAFAFAF